VKLHFVEQHGAEAGRTGANDIDLVHVAYMNGRLGLSRAPLQRDLKDPGVRFLDTHVTRVDDAGDERAEADPIHVGAQCSVRVRHDRQREVSIAQGRQRRPDVVGNQLPQVVGLVIGVQLRQRVGGRSRSLNAGMLEDEVEEQPASPRIGRGADCLAIVELFASDGFRTCERGRRDGDAAARERFADLGPVRKRTPPASRNTVRSMLDRRSQIADSFRL
jgi:hypothetical protein